MTNGKDVSIVVPMMDEEENVVPLLWFFRRSRYFGMPSPSSWGCWGWWVT